MLLLVSLFLVLVSFTSEDRISRGVMVAVRIMGLKLSYMVVWGAEDIPRLRVDSEERPLGNRKGFL